MASDRKDRSVDILMYHSISNGVGPTNISADIFQAHLDALAENDYRVLTLGQYFAWRRNHSDQLGRVAILTFDDGFLDFLTEASPRLEEFGWKATVFLPTGHVGGTDSWEKTPSRPLLHWRDVRQLHANGTEFGAHTVNHVDLVRTPLKVALREIIDSQSKIEDETGGRVKHFAAPYGRVNGILRRELRGVFEASVGTRLARANPSSPLDDLPRVDMHYFRNPRRFREYLAGKGDLYFSVRKLLRTARRTLQGH